MSNLKIENIELYDILVYNGHHPTFEKYVCFVCKLNPIIIEYWYDFFDIVSSHQINEDNLRYFDKVKWSDLSKKFKQDLNKCIDKLPNIGFKIEILLKDIS